MLAQSDKRTHFGPGAHTGASSIEIRWPSSVRQSLEHVPGDRIRRTEEPQAGTLADGEGNFGFTSEASFPSKSGANFPIQARKGTPLRRAAFRTALCWRQHVAFCALAASLAGAPGFGQQPALSSPETILPAQQMLLRAHDLMQAGQFQQAEGVLRQALVAAPQWHEAHAALAYCLLREDQPAKALVEYTRAAAIHAPDSEELTQVGQAYVLLHDDTDADRWTLRAVRMNPSDAEAWYSLGRIRYTEQYFADAAACFEHVLALRPHNVKAENNLGLAEEGMNHTQAAVLAYRQAIASEAAPFVPGDEQPYLNLAIVLLHTGALAEAQPLLARALAISPHDPRIFEQIGHLHLQQEDAKGAADAFNQAVRLDPSNSGLHFLLGQAYRRLGQKQQAETEFATATRLARPPSGTGAR